MRGREINRFLRDKGGSWGPGSWCGREDIGKTGGKEFKRTFENTFDSPRKSLSKRDGEELCGTIPVWGGGSTVAVPKQGQSSRGFRVV